MNFYWKTIYEKKWRECFASHLSIEEQKRLAWKIFCGIYVAREKVKCLEKDAAITAFLNHIKQRCTIFYQFIDDAYLFEKQINYQSMNDHISKIRYAIVTCM
ncbi:DUF4275 family protein [Metabacillus crassostreae]|uniref:DUF4275 family protein n=1 Tax=Metabacillus crassostreae TaxID=929098 RepID=UPI00195EDA27